jgi:hypothetical protein
MEHDFFAVLLYYSYACYIIFYNNSIMITVTASESCSLNNFLVHKASTIILIPADNHPKCVRRCIILNLEMLGTMVPSNLSRSTRAALKRFPSIRVAVERSLSSAGIQNEASRQSIASQAETNTNTTNSTSMDMANNSTSQERHPSPTKIRPPMNTQSRQSQSKETSRPKASNPLFFKERFDVLLKESHHVPRKAPLPPKTLEQQVQHGGTLAKQLESGGEKLPQSCWVQVDNIPPLSSLNAILMGVKTALDIEQERGIVDLDASWEPEEDGTIPFLPTNSEDWVLTAKIILSPFGRPTGWHLCFQNRSIVHALLTHARETPIRCAWKKVGIKQGTGVSAVSSASDPDETLVSDATLRVENCSDDTMASTLVRFFSRYDLTQTGSSVVQWEGITIDGKVAPRTFLVHFADASWARAALREKQSAFLKGKTLRLAQYPKQILV